VRGWCIVGQRGCSGVGVVVGLLWLFFSISIGMCHRHLLILTHSRAGVTFACSQLAAVQYCAQIAPRGLETSAQGLKSTVQGVGGVIGVYIGGNILDSYGAIILYRGCSALVAVTTVGYCIVIWCHNCSSTEGTTKLDGCDDGNEKRGSTTTKKKAAASVSGDATAIELRSRGSDNRDEVDPSVVAL
jgi:hypothetical protein